VDDLEARFLPLQRINLPRRPGKRLAIAPGGAADNPAIHDEAHAQPLHIRPTTNLEVDEAPLDPERRAREPAGRLIPAEEGVDEALPLEAGDRLLAGERSLRGTATHRRPFGSPVAVVVALERRERDGRSRPALGWTDLR